MTSTQVNFTDSDNALSRIVWQQSGKYMYSAFSSVHWSDLLKTQVSHQTKWKILNTLLSAQWSTNAR